MDIFVGSLPFKLKEDELKEIFEKYGKVESVTFIINKSTRMNKGYGFVVMPDTKEAMNAIELLNGTEIMDRRIEVSISENDKEESAKPKDKNSITWRKEFFRKKPKPSVLTWGDDKKRDKPKRAGVKKAKNFKVGARKKK